MNALLERHPWRCALGLAVLLSTLVGGLGAAAPAPLVLAAAASVLVGAVVTVGVGLLGSRAASLAEHVGQGTGASRLMGAEPWRTALLIGAVAGAVRGGAALGAGEPLAEAGRSALLLFAPWALVLGLLGQIGIRQPGADDDRGEGRPR